MTDSAGALEAVQNWFSQLDGADAITVAVICLYLIPLANRRYRETWWRQKFGVHRILGQFFLLQYALAWRSFLRNPMTKGEDPLRFMLLAGTGFSLASSAAFYFRFLPKKDDPGYFGDKGVLSRNFVTENIFYQMMVLFGASYYSNIVMENFYHAESPQWLSILGHGMEALYVFFPYSILRPLFPTTRMSIANATGKSRSEANTVWYQRATLFIKIAYLFGKHFGLFVNYARYLNLFQPEDLMWLRFFWLTNAGTVSIAVFLHTLRFKGLLPPKVAFSIYTTLFYAAAIPVYQGLIPFLLEHMRLFYVMALGLAVNMQRDNAAMNAWYVSVAILLTHVLDHGRVSLDDFSSEVCYGALTLTAAACIAFGRVYAKAAKLGNHPLVKEMVTEKEPTANGQKEKAQ
eukprot:Clim_evm1s20 gene=Clim_evmTU1s20